MKEHSFEGCFYRCKTPGQNFKKKKDLYGGFSPYANFITVNFITANFITAIFQKFPNIQLMQNLDNATFSQEKKLL